MNHREHREHRADTEKNILTERVIGAAIEVHKTLGPGLLESTYETCLAYELKSIGLRVERQQFVPLRYKQINVEQAFKLDLLVESQLILELKCVEQLQPIHEAQMLTYLKLTGGSIGLLINFNSKLLKDGIRRFIL